MIDRYFEEHEDNSREELKRAEHLVLISLKYNRTCAVMKNGLIRLITSYESAIWEYLEFLRAAKKLDEVPGAMKDKVEMIKDLLGGAVTKYIRAYNKLVKLNKAQYCGLNEFRKGLMMRTLDKKPIELDIKGLEEQLRYAQEFVGLIEVKTRE
jgi:hypothetical protein